MLQHRQHGLLTTTQTYNYMVIEFTTKQWIKFNCLLKVFFIHTYRTTTFKLKINKMLHGWSACQKIRKITVCKNLMYSDIIIKCSIHTFHPDNLQSWSCSAHPLLKEILQCLLVYHLVGHLWPGTLCPRKPTVIFCIKHSWQECHKLHVKTLTFKTYNGCTLFKIYNSLYHMEVTFLGSMLNFLRPMAICLELLLTDKKNQILEMKY